jgi:hypothetical protein
MDMKCINLQMNLRVKGSYLRKMCNFFRWKNGTRLFLKSRFSEKDFPLFVKIITKTTHFINIWKTKLSKNLALFQTHLRILKFNSGGWIINFD